jgi:nitrogen fixation NifU-like protein
MTDAGRLYQEVIMDHNKRPRNYGVLAGANRRAEGHNPLCGDHIRLSLQLENGVIHGIAFQGETCAICKASASMMTTAVKGKSVADAETLIQEFRDMATGKLDAQSQTQHLGRLNVFAGVRELPTRVKCAVLPWHTLRAAFHNEPSATTEAGEF